LMISKSGLVRRRLMGRYTNLFQKGSGNSTFNQNRNISAGELKIFIH